MKAENSTMEEKEKEVTPLEVSSDVFYAHLVIMLISFANTVNKVIVRCTDFTI